MKNKTPKTIKCPFDEREMPPCDICEKKGRTIKAEERSRWWQRLVDILDGQFPKGKCKERGQALVLLAYAEMALKEAEKLLSTETQKVREEAYNEGSYKGYNSGLHFARQEERKKLLGEIEKEITKAERMEGKYKDVKLAIHTVKVLEAIKRS